MGSDRSVNIHNDRRRVFAGPLHRQQDHSTGHTVKAEYQVSATDRSASEPSVEVIAVWEGLPKEDYDGADYVPDVTCSAHRVQLATSTSNGPAYIVMRLFWRKEEALQENRSRPQCSESVETLVLRRREILTTLTDLQARHIEWSKMFGNAMTGFFLGDDRFGVGSDRCVRA